MQQFKPSELKKLYIPPPESHKGQNGKLLIIAGSKLFHAPAIWPAESASRIVDMVYVASTPENNKILQGLKGKFWDGIVIRREDLDDYAKEADCILIGPGLPRPEGQQEGDDDSRKLVKHVLCDLLPQSKISHLDNHVVSEVRKNRALQNKQNKKNKKVVIDGGALQVMELEWIPRNAILTPHRGEWGSLLKTSSATNFFSVTNSAPRRTSGPPASVSRQMSVLRSISTSQPTSSRRAGLKQPPPAKKLFPSEASRVVDDVLNFAKQHECIVLLKGGEDIICSPKECRVVKGGNAGMTKGGTGDVLAGLVAALACKNDPFLAACAGSYLNKAAGDSLYKSVGPYFNASDLVKEIPRLMKDMILDSRRL